ncbi:WD40/YVTN/BNR-like repeat-containing protein [Tellurirhabdus rosea]|uniref:WD40/YVTN/BNR-like repeat-containing protein n=1 Tax=Tellurirhabdus rosea TaxID=2674997 RepID=UPI0022584360|nr:glycosyl hydrolase [Tellurirhabdus rosea]
MNKILLPLTFLTLATGAMGQQKNRKKTAATQTAQMTAATERLSAFGQRRKLTTASLLRNVPFRNIGPTVMSGRVVDMAVNPDNPNQFYVAYASGGLWRTDNNGLSFEPLFDREAVMTLGAVAVDWKTGTLWVGTGEANASRSSYSGVGVYKSTDGGKTWQHLPGLEETHHIGRIVLHPTTPNVAWVAATGHLFTANKERGLYKTTDGGKTWKQTLYIDDKTGAIDVDLDPANPQVLYASMWHKERKAWNFVEGGKTSGIYKSTDGGETWKLISGGRSGFPQDENTGRIGLSIFPQNPQILYAILDNQAIRPKKDDEEPGKLTKEEFKGMTKEKFLDVPDSLLTEYLDEQNFPEKYTAKSLKELVRNGKLAPLAVLEYTDDANSKLINAEVVGAEIYRSDNGGQSWRKVNEDYLDGVYNTYGYYFGNVWIAPDNADKIYTAGVPVIGSEDGGKTWKGLDAANVHADHHALWINPKNNKHLILGNDGGINISYDGGKTWFKANTPAVGQFYAITVDMAKPYNVYGGLQDNGVWMGPSTYKASPEWYDNGDYPYKSLLGGDGMQVQVDWRDNKTVYTGFQFGNYFRINRETGERKKLEFPEEVGQPKLRFNWQSPILVSRHNQDVVYFGSNRFHRSLDRGDEFKVLSGDLTRGRKEGDVSFGTLTTIDESPLRFGLIYTGSDDGLIHVSRDGGYTWTRISDGLPAAVQPLWVSRVTASAHDEGTVYATLNGYRNDHFRAYVFRSTDYGKTWQPIGTDLPAEPVNVLKEDPKNPDVLYVGTDHGLYASLDRGRSFMILGEGLPAVAVHDLVVHPRENELIVGTHGRSLYVGDVSYLQSLTDSVRAKDLYVYKLKNETYRASRGRMYNKYSEKPEYQFTMPFYARTAGRTTVRLMADSLTLRTLTDTSEAGLNYLSFDYAIDSTARGAYQGWLNDHRTEGREINLKPADDGKIYLRPGKYTFVFETAGGASEKKSWELKAPERKKWGVTSLPKPGASPDEWEEWMEEQGFEEKK